MNGRERVLRALAHREGDRIPYDQSSRSSAIELEPYGELKAYLGINTPTRCFIRSHAVMEEPVRRRLGIDTEFIRWMPPESWKRDGNDDLFIDAWEVPWRRRAGSHYYELDHSPLAAMDRSMILTMPWRPLVSDSIADTLQEMAAGRREGEPLALFSDQIGAGLFERAWYLRGLEQFLVELLLEKRWVHAFMERILQHQMEGYERIFSVIGADIIGVLMTDDLAAQQSLLVSRETYREMILPYHRRLLDFIRSRGQKVVFHSCGAVQRLIPDLLEAGVEIIHPIQHTAVGMDPLSIKREYGKDLVLWGAGCDTSLLQYGSVHDIREDVRRRVEALGRDGGFVYTTTHCIQPGTPPENILAMADALHRYGVYRG